MSTIRARDLVFACGSSGMRSAQERVRNSRLEAFAPMMEAVGKFRDEMDKPKN
jgi:hypothetical protein